MPSPSRRRNGLRPRCRLLERFWVRSAIGLRLARRRPAALLAVEVRRRTAAAARALPAPDREPGPSATGNYGRPTVQARCNCDGRLPMAAPAPADSVAGSPLDV